jgi:hypothetical protein
MAQLGQRVGRVGKVLRIEAGQLGPGRRQQSTHKRSSVVDTQL